MKRLLRHPINSIREPFGTAGLVVAMIALILALGGTALAAAKLNGKQKKEVEKIAKRFAGKPGAPGAQGAAGTNGTNGKDGTNGKNGTNGESVTVNAYEGEECEEASEEGGVELNAGIDTAYVCNGEPGEEGNEGSPWVAGTAPEGVLMKGSWAIPQYTAAAANESIPVPFSTVVPINTGPVVPVFVINGVEQPDTSGFPGGPWCTGNASAPTSARPGILCAYTLSATNLKNQGLEASSWGGGAIGFGVKSIAAGNVTAWGSWALLTP